MRKIMIVDDEEMMLKVAQRVLSADYETVCASSGGEALEVYERERPDMILSDLLMPGMSGFEMHKCLQERYGVHIPVVFMTADESGDIEGEGFAMGADDFIRKPFRPDVLLKRVDNIIKNIERIDSLTAEATTDSFTGFYNKSHVTRELSEVCCTQSGTLLLTDLDNFKLVNDIYGHDMGDKILTAFADVMRRNIRTDDIVGRIGGDEFVVFIGGETSEKTVASVVRRVNEQLLSAARSLMGEDMNIPLGVSAGAVFVPQHGRDYESLFNMADKALYYVKQNEKHGYAVYMQNYAGNTDGEETPEQTMHKLSMVFEERNISDSALWLGQDSFGQVYRFMMRYIQSYRGMAYKALLTVKPFSGGIGGAELAAIAEQFGGILDRSLRKSDIMMQYRSNSFFLLLPEMSSDNIGKVLDRVTEQWNKTEFSKRVSIEYVTEAVYADDLDERERRRRQ
ncbi:MAG: diguanylate cyclase [Firmicutes bacterium]|nr:diguanylate cyclase [Bacillota bacterium]